MSKKISKTQSVTSQIDQGIASDDVHIGPSDHVPWLNDRKWAYIRLEGRNFGDVPLNIELKLEVWDSPNSAGVIIDAVRCCQARARPRHRRPAARPVGVLHEVAAGAVPRRRGAPDGRGVRCGRDRVATRRVYATGRLRMTNIEAWDRIAAPAADAGRAGVVQYGPDLPTEADLRLCGDVTRQAGARPRLRRGRDAVAMARQARTSIAIDVVVGAARARASGSPTTPRSASSGTRATSPISRSCAPTRSTSRSPPASCTRSKTSTALFRQVHRVLRPGAAFVFSHEHPMRTRGRARRRRARRASARPARGSPLLLRPRADRTSRRRARRIQVWPRTIADVFSALHRAATASTCCSNPSRCASSGPGPAVRRPPIALAGPQGRRSEPGSTCRVARAHRGSRSRRPPRSEISPSSRRISSRNVERLADDAARLDAEDAASPLPSSAGGSCASSSCSRSSAIRASSSSMRRASALRLLRCASCSRSASAR